jgi:hypothetical protein
MFCLYDTPHLSLRRRHPVPTCHDEVKERTMNRPVAMMLLGVPVALTLCGCLTMSANVTGSEVGGTVPMAGITRQQAADLAKSHCARYGRSSHILAIRSEDGVKAVFECT